MYPTISTVTVSEIYTGICRCAEDGSIEALFNVINRDNLGTNKPVDYEEWKPVFVNGVRVFVDPSFPKTVVPVVWSGTSPKKTLVHKDEFFIDDNGFLCSVLWFIDHNKQDMEKVKITSLLRGVYSIRVLAD